MQPIKKKTWNVAIDVMAYIAFIALAMTGVIMYFLLPPGSGHNLSIWGLGRHDWGDIHFWAAVSFFGILVLHLILHWRWILSALKGSPKKESKWRFLAGTVGLLAIILISLAPVLSPVEESADKGYGDEPTEITVPGDIKGSMTLEEVSAIFDIPPGKLIEHLGLPGDVDITARLGQLKSEYGFDMHELREFVELNLP